MYQLIKKTTYNEVQGVLWGAQGGQGCHPMKQEALVQSAFCTYLKYNYPKIRYCASLGGIRTSMKQAVLAKKTGYVKGFPDMQILKVNHLYAGLFLEIKADKKCYPTKEQKQWVEYLNEAGYYAKVVKGLDECIETADWYLNIP